MSLASHWNRSAALAALTLAIVGCDDDTTATRDAGDHGEHDAGADAGLTCEIAEDCRSSGDAIPVCEKGRCVPFVCSDDASCHARGPAFANHVCEQQQCVLGECTSDAECQDERPTATCGGGRCADPAY